MLVLAFRTISAAVLIAAAAFVALFGLTILSSIWGYRDSRVQTYVVGTAFMYASAAVFLSGAVILLVCRRAGWLILGLLLAIASLIPYWLWVENIRVTYANNIVFGSLALIALTVYALTRRSHAPASEPQNH